jgi:hypothetical protein
MNIEYIAELSRHERKGEEKEKDYQDLEKVCKIGLILQNAERV